MHSDEQLSNLHLKCIDLLLGSMAKRPHVGKAQFASCGSSAKPAGSGRLLRRGRQALGARPQTRALERAASSESASSAADAISCRR